jgi:predicted DNA-binding transcriptional regulator AlpA
VTEQTIPIEDVIDSVTVRRLAAPASLQKKPISRNALLRWRADRDFPAPFKRTESGIELWDAREVRRWVRDHS